MYRGPTVPTHEPVGDIPHLSLHACWGLNGASLLAEGEMTEVGGVGLEEEPQGSLRKQLQHPREPFMVLASSRWQPGWWGPVEELSQEPWERVRSDGVSADSLGYPVTSALVIALRTAHWTIFLTPHPSWIELVL